MQLLGKAKALYILLLFFVLLKKALKLLLLFMLLVLRVLRSVSSISLSDGILISILLFLGSSHKLSMKGISVSLLFEASGDEDPFDSWSPFFIVCSISLIRLGKKCIRKMKLTLNNLYTLHFGYVVSTFLFLM